MDEKMQAKAAEVIRTISNDPKLLEEFQNAPTKTIEKVAGIDIPDLLEPMVEKVIKEQLAKGSDASDPMDIIKKFIK